MGITVIATVLNEAETIGPLLDSLAAQTREPDAIIIIDGGSTDGTLDILRAREAQGTLPLRVIEAPGANIACGRNIAIGAAKTDLIATTDAGTTLDPEWLQNLIAPFEGSDPPDVVAGFFITDPQTVFETALGATVIPVVEDVNPDRFLPSSRSLAFRKGVWKAVGGYPEWLDFCEDILFDLWLRQDGYRIEFAPGAVAHFRPRSTLGAFFWQYYRYARGDGRADLWPERHAIRYVTYLFGMTLLRLMTLGVGGGRRGASANSQTHMSWLALVALVTGAGFVFRPPVVRLLRLTQGWPWSKRLRALAWVPIIRVIGDVAKMLGYPVGRWWRWQHRMELLRVRGRPPFELSQFLDRS